MDTPLRLAVQKSGRLSEKSLAFVEACGISYTRNKTKLKTTASNFPLEILFLRDDDIPRYVATGVADIGIVGENVFAEKAEQIEVVEPMGFSKCRLSIAIPQNVEYTGPAMFEGKRIATSYPVLLQNFLDANNVKAQIHEISGSVEIAPGIGLADAVCDLVSTGSTLLSNGLKEVEVIFKSQAVLVKTPELSPEKQAVLDRLHFRIKAVLKAKNYKYILMNVPNRSIETVIGLLPGMKSPTVMPLATEGWSSVHTVIKEDDFWGIVDQLHEVGAEGILVSPIEKMVL
ncbi:MAG: ATP phosphoribosyltransferase [Bacteroidota bacterium]